MRKTQFVNNEFYHIYNRGADKRVILPRSEDFDRFLQSIEEFNNQEPIGSIFEHSFIKSKLGGQTTRLTRLVNIICYCLNPNHYHMILQQQVNGGISEFMKRLGGYTRYVNIKYERSGVLFQGKFKAAHIDSNEYLLRASAYVNLNNRVHRLHNNAFCSSWDEYIDRGGNNICSKGVVLNQFNNKSEYKSFAQEALRNILEHKQMAKELESTLLE